MQWCIAFVSCVATTWNCFCCLNFSQFLEGKKNLLKSVFCEKWLPRAAVRSVKSVSHLSSVWLPHCLPLWVCLGECENRPGVSRCSVWKACSWGCVCGLMLWREVTLVSRVTKELPLACSTDRITHSSFPKNNPTNYIKMFFRHCAGRFP